MWRIDSSRGERGCKPGEAKTANFTENPNLSNALHLLINGRGNLPLLLTPRTAHEGLHAFFPAAPPCRFPIHRSSCTTERLEETSSPARVRDARRARSPF